MNNIFTLLITSIFLSLSLQTFSQCEVTATAIPTDILCGNCATISAFGEGQGQSVFTEEFTSGSPTGWLTTSSADYTNPCSPGIGGGTHLWMGNATGVPRQLITTAFDFTPATAGATICFDLLFAEQGDASPCEGPDEPDEGVAIQYSIDGGITWIDIHYFDPNGGNDPSLINWNNWCFAVPAAALTNSTQFRWFQDNDSGADYDHWGLDNVNIYFNDPTYTITWAHDNHSYGIGNGGGDNPTPVCPNVTETYLVTMTNGTETCSDSITINVTLPDFRVDAGADTTICAGECVDVFGEATVIVSPAKTPTYQNNEVAVLTGLPSASDLASLLLPCLSFGGCSCPDGSSVGFGQSCPTIYQGALSMNINITDLNTTSLQNGQLTSICLNDVLMLAGDLSLFDIELTCPSGTTITLANAGDLAGTTLTNACFDLTSTSLISTGTSPYTGNWQPVQPLTTLSGCSGNGVWTLTMVGTFDLATSSLPLGALNGWDISFDDPEISYEGDFVWSPIATMTNDTTLTPNICPTATESYVLAVTDSAGCVTISDTVVITLDNSCCNFNLDAIVTQPSCANNDGNIDMTTSGGSGLFTYNWTSGQGNTEDLNSLAAGTYNLMIIDTVQNCQKDTIITLTSPSAVSIDSSVVTNATCGENNGSIEIFTTSVGSISYSIDSGLTSQSSTLFDSLMVGNYTVFIEDTSGCSAFEDVVITNAGGINITNVNVTNETCSESNGEIEIIVNVGSSPAFYSIDSGVTTQVSNVFDSLSAGTYIAFVEDVNGCTFSQTVTITNSPGLTLTSTGEINGSCGSDTASITLAISGGTAPIIYSIDNGANTQISNSFTNLADGIYNVLITDSVGCSVDTVVTINNGISPTINTITNTDASCGNNDGSIVIGASGGFGVLTYSIDGGVNFQSLNTFDTIVANTYTIVVEDGNGCQVDSITTISNANGPSLSSAIVVDGNCGVDTGSLSLSVTGGVSPLTYSIDSGTTTQLTNSFSNLADGMYNVQVADSNGCTLDTVITINNGNGPSITNTGEINGNCGSDTASITLTIAGGTTPINYSIDNGVNTQLSNSFINLVDGVYNVLVTDDNGCSVDTIVTINNGISPIIDSIVTTDASCGNNDGSISIGASGGFGALTYSIDGGTSFQALNNFNLVGANLYNLVVEDVNGCQVDSVTTINNANGPSITSAGVVNGNCATDTGSITITVSGGVLPFTYSIDSGVTSQAGNSFTNLADGVYNIVVVDSNNCPVFAVTTIDNGENPTMSVVENDATCGNNDGELIITASNGVAPYTYSINNGTSFQATNTFNNLSATTYNVVVQDNNGCEVSNTATIQNANSPEITAVNIVNEICKDDANGNISLTIANGVLPYTINWNTGQSSQSISDLAVGDYTVTVTDANLCSVDTTVSILEGISPSLSLTNDTTITLGESVTIQSFVANSSAGLYNWSPTTGLSCIDCENPVATPLVATEYVLNYTDTPSLCNTSATILIQIVEEINFCIFPNAFSPNNDGVNDEFGPVCDEFEIVDLQIFNRWGELIYISKSETTLNKWDGTYKNIDAALDLYIYKATIEYKDGRIDSINGNVSLIR